MPFRRSDFGGFALAPADVRKSRCVPFFCLSPPVFHSHGAEPQAGDRHLPECELQVSRVSQCTDENLIPAKMLADSVVQAQ